MLCPNRELTGPNHEQRTEEKTIVSVLVTTVRGKVIVPGTVTWLGRQDPLLPQQQLVRRSTGAASLAWLEWQREGEVFDEQEKGRWGLETVIGLW